MSEPELVCDFCLAPEPPWEYPAGEVTLPGDVLSLGPWAACETCRELIDADEREALAERSYNRRGTISLGVIRMAQAEFFRARQGEARPVRLTPIHGRIFER